MSSQTNSSCRRCAARSPAAAGRTTNLSRRAAGSVSGWRARSPQRSPPPRPGTPRRGGRGEIIDVSTYEAMVIAMGGLSTMSASVLGVDSVLQQRSLELPSIVPTADGMVGFCTITAQQFQDFLVMIDRADLVDDAELASMRRAHRAPRRVPRHGHPVDGDPHHARDRRSCGGVPNSGRPHRNSRHAATGRPLRATRSVRRIGAGGDAAAGAVSQRRDRRQGRPDGPRGSAPTTAASTGRRGRSDRTLSTPPYFRCPTYG